MRSFICKHAGHSYIAFSDTQARCSCCGAVTGGKPTRLVSVREVVEDPVAQRKKRISQRLSILASMTAKSAKVKLAEKLLSTQVERQIKNYAILDDSLDVLEALT